MQLRGVNQKLEEQRCLVLPGFMGEPLLPQPFVDRQTRVFDRIDNGLYGGTRRWLSVINIVVFCSRSKRLRQSVTGSVGLKLTHWTRWFIASHDQFPPKRRMRLRLPPVATQPAASNVMNAIWTGIRRRYSL